MIGNRDTPGMSEHIIPVASARQPRKSVQRLALRAHAALKCRGYSRVDMIVEPEAGYGF